MAIDTSKVVLPPAIPYGFGFQPDTVMRSDLAMAPLMKPVSADMEKQAADSSALAKPANTQVSIEANDIRLADELAKKKKQRQYKQAQTQQPVTVQQPVQQQQTAVQQPAPTLPVQTVPQQTPVPSTGTGDTAPVVSDTPDSYSSPSAASDDERKKIHTLFQTITGKDAIPYGEKWRWYLEHGFTGMHGGLHQELMNQVNAETAAFQNAGPSRTFGQELRANEMKRKTLMQQWDKLLWEWNHGYYSGDETTVKDFYRRADKLKSAMIANGIDEDLIRDPSINAGGFAQGFQKDLSAKRNDIDWLAGWMNTIEAHIAEDPNWLNRNDAQMEFDKMSEYIILKWAQSKGAIADAEKIRAQVEAMPDEDRAYYNAFTSQFFRGNNYLQIKAFADAGSESAKKLIEEINRLVNIPKGKEGGTVKINADGTSTIDGETHIMQLLALVNAEMQHAGQQLPIDLATGLASYKASKEAFDDYIMKNANVDRAMVWNSAMDQLNINLDAYRRMIPKLGLNRGWDYDGRMPSDISQILANHQRTNPTNKVIRDAKLAMPLIGEDTADNLNFDAKGGFGGVTPKSAKSAGVPKALEGLNAKQLKNGNWQYYDPKTNTVKIYKGSV